VVVAEGKIHFANMRVVAQRRLVDVEHDGEFLILGALRRAFRDELHRIARDRLNLREIFRRVHELAHALLEQPQVFRLGRKGCGEERKQCVRRHRA